MLLSPRENGLTSLFKEVRVFKVSVQGSLSTLFDTPGWKAREGLLRILGLGGLLGRSVYALIPLRG